MRLKVFMIFIFFSLENVVVCQDIKDADIEIFDESTGLSNRSITEIVQDKMGYLWIATIDGLNLYDGYSFKVFKHFQNDSNSIQDNFVRSLTLDRNGNLWIGYRTGGLSLYDYEKKSFRNFSSEQLGSPKAEVFKIYADHENSIWVGIARKGLYKFDKKNNKLIHVSDLTRETGWSASNDGWDNTVHDIYEDTSGTLWLSTENGLYTYDKNDHLTAVRSEEELTSKKAHVLRKLMVAKEGLWMSSAFGSGLLYYDFQKKSWTQFKYPRITADGLIYDIQIKSDDELWIGTEADGLGIFSIKTQTFSFSPVKLTFVAVLFEDSFGIIWAASASGLVKFDPAKKKFHLTDLKVSRKDEWGNQFLVTCFLQDSSSHSLFMGTTYADGLHVINEITGNDTHYEFERPPGEKFLRTRSLFKDHQGNIWVLTSGFLYRFDKKLNKLVKALHPRNSLEPFFLKMTEDHAGNLWMTSALAGLFKFDTKKQTYNQYVHSPKDPTGMPENNLTGVVEDKFNRLWVATANEGVGIFDPEKKSFTRIEGFKEKLVTSMTRGPKGDIWVSSLGGGICQFKLENDRTIHPKIWQLSESTLSKNVLWLYFENENSLWFGTHSSVSRLSIPDEKIVSYGAPDGLYSEFRFYSIYSSGGYLYMGTRGGYYKFMGEKIKSDTVPPRIVLNYIRSKDQEIFPKFISDKAHIELEPQQNSFAFEFTALNFINPSKNQYAYKLEGFDEDWLYSGTRHYGNYINLDPGSYTLLLKGSNGNNIWNEKGISISITIAKPFWRTAWFYAVSFSFVITLAYLFYRYKIKQVRREEALLRKFSKQKAELKMQALRAQINPHFIFNCLNSVNRYILTRELQEASHYLTKFSKLIRGILENSQTKMVSVENELSMLKLYMELEANRFEKKFDYTIEVDPDINPTTVRIPPLVIQPFVENAIWHGLLNKQDKGLIEIKLTCENDSIKCSVKDNGIGREMSRKLKGNSVTHHESLGIEITRKRLLLLYQNKRNQPVIQITDLYNESNFPSGTQVLIAMPYVGARS